MALPAAKNKRPHPPCGHLLPGGEKGDVSTFWVYVAGCAVCVCVCVCVSNARSQLPSPRRGEGGRRPDEGPTEGRMRADSSCVDTNAKAAARKGREECHVNGRSVGVRSLLAVPVSAVAAGNLRRAIDLLESAHGSCAFRYQRKFQVVHRVAIRGATFYRLQISAVRLHPVGAHDGYDERCGLFRGSRYRAETDSRASFRRGRRSTRDGAQLRCAAA